MRYYQMIYNGDMGMRDNHIGSQKILNNNMQDYTVCCGKYVNNWDSNITLLCNDKRENVVPDWISSEEDWLIVSQRFVDTINHLENGNIQYLPIKVDAVQPQMQTEIYYVANVIKVLDVIDYDKSDWWFITDTDRDPINYVIKKDEIKGNHIFIVKEDILSSVIMVSEEFKKAIKRAKLSGFGFFEVKVV